MVIEHSYLEARTIITGMLKHIFKSLQQNHGLLIEKLKRQFPHDGLVFPEETVVLGYTDGIALMKGSGWREEDGEEIKELEGLSRLAEVRLGQLVKEKYNTDYYILGAFFNIIEVTLTQILRVSDSLVSWYRLLPNI